MDVEEVVQALKAGKTLLYPTDTILGIGCNALDAQAIQKVNRLKNRPADKSLIVLVDSDAMLQRYVEVPDVAWDIMDFSEKPITLIYDNPSDLPVELVAQDASIAIRKTNDPLCRKIIQRLRAPLVSTSANLSGSPAPQIWEEVAVEIREGVDVIHPDCMEFKPKFTASSIIKIRANGEVKVIRE